MEEDACLSNQQHQMVMQALRSLYYKDETVHALYEQHVTHSGVDMAQRRRRSLFRREMRRCFGHAVVADVLVIKGYWSKELQDRLVKERGCQHIAGSPEESKPLPSTHRTSTGRRQVHGSAKSRKRERYFANKAAKEHLKEC